VNDNKHGVNINKNDQRSIGGNKSNCCWIGEWKEILHEYLLYDVIDLIS